MLITFIFNIMIKIRPQLISRDHFNQNCHVLGITTDEIYDRSNDRKYGNYNTSRKKMFLIKTQRLKV